MSRLGIGTLRLNPDMTPEAFREIVLYGLENGISYIDCAPTYCEGRCEGLVGEAVRPFREKIRLASKVPLDVLKKPGDTERFLTDTLRRLGTERLDYYYLWAVKRAPFETVALKQGFLRELYVLKERGLIGKIGFSFHDEPAFAPLIIDAAIRAGTALDAMLCQYNLLHPEMAGSMAYAKNAGLEVHVMGPAAGGKLDPKVSYPFVLENQNVDIVLAGITGLSMLKEDLRLESTLQDNSDKAANMKMTESERQKKQALLQLYCTGCGYCLPCPSGIGIPILLAIWQRYLLSEDAEALQREYRGYTRKYGLPEDQCTRCGRCEAHCPQGLPVREWITRNINTFIERTPKYTQ